MGRSYRFALDPAQRIHSFESGDLESFTPQYEHACALHASHATFRDPTTSDRTRIPPDDSGRARIAEHPPCVTARHVHHNGGAAFARLSASSTGMSYGPGG